MKRKKIIIPILNYDVFAAYGEVTNQAGTQDNLLANTLFFGSGKGPKLDYTFYEYAVGGQQA
jgi:hypothetical protein